MESRLQPVSAPLRLDRGEGSRVRCRSFLCPYPFAILLHSGLRSEEHTSELQSLAYLVCRLLLEKKKSFYWRDSCRRGSNISRCDDCGRLVRGNVNARRRVDDVLRAPRRHCCGMIWRVGVQVAS